MLRDTSRAWAEAPPQAAANLDIARIEINQLAIECGRLCVALQIVTSEGESQGGQVVTGFQLQNRPGLVFDITPATKR